VIFGVAAVALTVFTLFPRQYVATVDLAPQDTNTSGLSSVLSQLGGNYAALVGNHQPVEIDLTVGRSYQVARTVAKSMGMIESPTNESLASAILRIEKKVDIRALRGSIIEIEVRDTDPDFALKLTTVFANAMQQRLAQLSRGQTEYKRTVLNNRMAEATDRLSRAEAAMNAFRTKYQLPEPDVELGAAVSQLTGLQGELLAKQVALQTALRFNTEESMQVKSIRSDIATLESQLHQAQMQARIPVGLTATGIADISNQYSDLNRELHFSQALFESYSRYLEGAAIEELTSDFNMQEIQPPYVDPSYHFNLWALESLFGLIVFAAASELYMARPPLSRRLARQ
jgi:uncharacterized protein involved in exopolysaccharide biosynthesis